MKSFKLPIIIMRCNNAVSPFQHDEKLIPRVINSIMSGKRVPVHGQGKSKRTFIHASDIATAIDVIAHRGEVFTTYNIGNHEEYSVMDVVEKILRRVKGPDASCEDWIEYVPDRAFQDYRYSVDTSALHALGWEPSMSFDASIDAMIACFLNRSTS